MRIPISLLFIALISHASAQEGIDMDMVGEWCRMKTSSTTSSGGSYTGECFNLSRDGSFTYSYEGSMSGTYGGTASQSYDAGRWSVSNNVLHTRSNSGQAGEYPYTKGYYGTDCALIMGEYHFVTYGPRGPWSTTGVVNDSAGTGPADVGKVDAALVGKWCIGNTDVLVGGGPGRMECFTLNGDGSYTYGFEGGKDFWGSSATNIADEGKWGARTGVIVSRSSRTNQTKQWNYAPTAGGLDLSGREFVKAK